jgi:hypothetical protein
LSDGRAGYGIEDGRLESRGFERPTNSGSTYFDGKPTHGGDVQDLPQHKFDHGLEGPLGRAEFRLDHFNQRVRASTQNTRLEIAGLLMEIGALQRRYCRRSERLQFLHAGNRLVTRFFSQWHSPGSVAGASLNEGSKRYALSLSILMAQMNRLESHRWTCRALTAPNDEHCCAGPSNLVITRGASAESSVRERRADSLVRRVPNQHGARRPQPSGALTLTTNIIVRSLEHVAKVDVEFCRRFAEAITKLRCLSESIFPTARFFIQLL